MKILFNNVNAPFNAFKFKNAPLSISAFFLTLRIKKALGISGVQSNNANWRGSTSEKSAQIDLLIDRRDHVINICECKFSLDTFSIDKDYSEKLRSKIATFKTVTKTQKSVFLTMITAYGVEKNKYANLLVQNEVRMDDLF